MSAAYEPAPLHRDLARSHTTTTDQAGPLAACAIGIDMALLAGERYAGVKTAPRMQRLRTRVPEESVLDRRLAWLVEAMADRPDVLPDGPVLQPVLREAVTDRVRHHHLTHPIEPVGTAS